MELTLALENSVEELKATLDCLNNAEHAIEGNGTISHNKLTRGDQVEITFWDDCCGISEELQGKISDPFFTTKPMGERTGLGLSISD